MRKRERERDRSKDVKLSFVNQSSGPIDLTPSLLKKQL